MPSLNILKTFLKNDQKLIFRDSFLIFMTIAGILIALICRYLLPWADQVLMAKSLMPSDTIPFALHETYPMLITFMALYNGTLMSGMMAGFLLLDEKDENTLQAISVTPVPFYYYTNYRFTLAAVFSFALSVAMLYIINIALLGFWQILLFSAAASLMSVMSALFLVIFSQNKVQGFAMGKFTSLAGWVILAGWFIPEPWQWLLGIFPPFLVHKAYWMALEEQQFWLQILGIAIIAQFILIALLTKAFNHKTNQ